MDSSFDRDRKQESREADWQAALNRMEGAYSGNTLRAYRGDFANFEEWCRANHWVCLPARAEAIAGFIQDGITKFSPATLRRQMAGIRKVHRLLKLENPVQDEEVQIALRRAFRTKARRQKQAKGLNQDLRDKLIAACGADLRGLRNRALIAVGYDTLSRRSELAGLRVEDLAHLNDGAMSVLIRRAKNDPFGDGRYGYLSPSTVKLLDAWFAQAKIHSGWMFRGVFGSRAGNEPLHPIGVNRVLKAAATAAGCSPDLVKALSGHSMRVGAAQDFMSKGAGILRIMEAGGWKSTNIIARYVENAELSTLAKY